MWEGTTTPFQNGMAKAWQRLKEHGFEESVVASCQFGSPHRKEFRFLTYLVDAVGLEVRCPGGHPHVKIEGAITKGTAAYVWELAAHLARFFSKALRRARSLEADESAEQGFESLVVNDLLASAQWKLKKVWAWKRKSHINVLEDMEHLP